MEKIYMNGKAFFPQKDFMICNVQEYEEIPSFTKPVEYERIYATKKGTFYKVKKERGKTEACIISKQDALCFLYENAAYIVTENYDAVFGEPERG